MATVKLVEFWINGALIPAIVAIGLTGNLTCVLVLRSRNLFFNPTFLNLLRWLALIDSLFLCSCFLTFSLPQLSSYYKKWIYPYMLPTLLPITSIFLNGSVFCVVSLAVERYLSVCQPQHMNKGSFRGYILPILGFAVFFNIPKFFELKTDIVISGDPPSIPFTLPTKLRLSPEYSYYTIVAGFFFMSLVPFTVVLVLNWLLLRTLRRLSSAVPTYVGSTSPSSSRFRRDRVSSYLLFSVAVVMAVSHLPKTILNVYEIYLAAISAELQFPYPWLVDVSHFSLALSSAINIFIFACQDKMFRQVLLSETFSCIKKKNKQGVYSTPVSQGGVCSTPVSQELNEDSQPLHSSTITTTDC